MVLALIMLLSQELPVPAATRLARGDILVATSKSHDPELGHAVILLVRFDQDGAIGLILNHPNGKAYEGGPVALGIRTLVRSRTKPDGAELVAGDVYILPGLVERTGARVYGGYTGWSAQQLKDEVARGLWKIRAFDSKIVFDAQPATLWDRLNGAPKPGVR